MINVWGDGAAELVSLKYQIQSKTIVIVTHWSQSFSRQSQSSDTLKIITVTKIVSNRHWSRTLTCHEHWLNSCFSKSGTLDSATYCITVPLIPTLCTMRLAKHCAFKTTSQNLANSIWEIQTLASLYLCNHDRYSVKQKTLLSWNTVTLKLNSKIPKIIPQKL